MLWNLTQSIIDYSPEAAAHAHWKWHISSFQKRGHMLDFFFFFFWDNGVGVGRDAWLCDLILNSWRAVTVWEFLFFFSKDKNFHFWLTYRIIFQWDNFIHWLKVTVLILFCLHCIFFLKLEFNFNYTCLETLDKKNMEFLRQSINFSCSHVSHWFSLSNFEHFSFLFCFLFALLEKLLK